MKEDERVVVVGGNPAGLSAASAVKRVFPSADVIVFEKDDYISYASCGLPYYIEGLVRKKNALFTLTPQDVVEKRGIDLRMGNEVIDVNYGKKELTVRNRSSSKEYSIEYDYLVIATGARAREAPAAGITAEIPGIFTLHTVPDALKIAEYIERENPSSVAVIGSGYIGLEMIGAYRHRGLEVYLIGPYPVFTTPIAEVLISAIKNAGIRFIKGFVTAVEKIGGGGFRIKTDTGDTIEADFVHAAIGVEPNTGIFLKEGLKHMKGAIETDGYMRTSISDVYAAGDCITVYHRLTGRKAYIPLAPAANKQGRIAGYTVAGRKIKPFPGVVGTSVWQTLDLFCAKTGLGPAEAEKIGYNPDYVRIEQPERAGYYPINPAYPLGRRMTVSLTFDKTSGKLLGGEIIAPTPLGAKKIDVISSALYAEFTVHDLASLDLSYAPPVAPVWDPLLVAANVASRKLMK